MTPYGNKAVKGADHRGISDRISQANACHLLQRRRLTGNWFEEYKDYEKMSGADRANEEACGESLKNGSLWPDKIR